MTHTIAPPPGATGAGSPHAPAGGSSSLPVVGRRHLPNRRPSMVAEIIYVNQQGDEREYLMGIGLDPHDGAVKELFLDGHKIGSDYDTLLDDSCILISRLLQSGSSVRDLSTRVSSGTRADSILAYILRCAAALERDGPNARLEEV